MADTAPSDSSPKEEVPREQSKEDEETRAARQELNKSSISDRLPGAAGGTTSSTGADKEAHPATPPAEQSDAQNNDSADQILSPKKKRGHDQLDTGKDAEDNDAKSTTSTDSAKDRASRLEPEKKRHRDGEATESETVKQGDTQSTSKTDSDDSKPKDQKAPQTSATAFAASGFSKLASSSSPFASFGGAAGGSGFASAGASKLSSFASPEKSSDSKPADSKLAAAPKLSFGGGNGVSPFAGLSSGSNGFGSGFGGGGSGSSFGSALSGAKPLGSFAAPGSKPLSSTKPAKPFGAPESDAESDDDEDEDGGDSQADNDRAASPEKESEDKKKSKPHKIEVNDGESGETTVVSVRAKVFHHDGDWKERGSGMLKVNVPQACVDFDNSGVPIPGSFDASGLELDDEEGKGHRVVRLLLRQDQTHRVILNTALLPTMKFQETAGLKSNGIMFTAFEGDTAKPVIINLKMTAANAKVLMNEIGVIQKELQSS